MRSRSYAGAITLVLSVAVIMAFATSPAMANSMQDKDRSVGNVSTAGTITEPHQDVFYDGEAGASAERDRRFSYQSRLMNRLTRSGVTTAPVDVQPEPGVFFNGEAGATAERDRRASAVTRAEQRGLMRVESVPEMIISGEPLVEWYEPFAESAGSGWGQAAGAGSFSYRGRRAAAPVYIYEYSPYPYDYWFAPITGD